MHYPRISVVIFHSAYADISAAASVAFGHISVFGGEPRRYNITYLLGNDIETLRKFVSAKFDIAALLFKHLFYKRAYQIA